MAAPTCSTDDTALEFHCPSSAQCEWWKCPDCGTTYDIERHVRMLPSGAIESTAD